MYEKFFNLEAEPFDLGPDHSFCFDFKSFSGARIFLAHAALYTEGFVVLTGDAGAGKTTLINQLAENLGARGNVRTISLDCTRIQPGDLLSSLAAGFGVEHPSDDRDELLQQFYAQLQRLQIDNVRALLILDEAQTLLQAAPEDLHLLNNIQGTGKPPLQIFFVGQPELHTLISSPSMSKIKQYIMGELQLEALEQEEVEPYVIHRLEKAGWQNDPVPSEDIFPLIHQFSAGVPGRINLVCGRLLAHACAEDRHDISVDDTRAILQQLQSEGVSADTASAGDDSGHLPEPEPQAPLPEPAPGGFEEESPDLAGFTALVEEQEGAAETRAPDDELNQITHEPRRKAKSHKRPKSSNTGKTGKHRRGKRTLYLGILTLFLLLWLGWLNYFSGGKGMEAMLAWLEEAASSFQPEPVQLQVESKESQPVDPLARRENSASKPQPVASPSPLPELVASNESGPEVASGTTTSAEPEQLPAPEPEPEPEVAAELPDTGAPVSTPEVITANQPETAGSFDCTVKSQISFANDSARLSQDAIELLNSLATYCLDSGLNKVRVTGYTDTWGDWDYNLQLSQRRAEAVAQFLIGRGVSPESVFAEGLGEYGFDQTPSAQGSIGAEQRRIVLLEIQPLVAAP